MSDQKKLGVRFPDPPVVAFIACLTFRITGSALFSLSIGWAGMLILVPWEQVELFTSQRSSNAGMEEDDKGWEKCDLFAFLLKMDFIQHRAARYNVT